MNFQFKNFESIKTIMPVLSFYNLKKQTTLVVLNSNLLFCLTFLKNHIGYQYKLLTVLQDLAGSTDTTILDEKPSVGDKFTLDLLKTKAGNTKISIFIMMTNLKIFRDDTTDNVEIANLANSPEDVKNKISQVCIAEYDTLDFAQSISSTSIAKNALKQLEAKKIEIPIDSDDATEIKNLKGQDKFKNLFNSESVAVGGKRKFNMNQLLEHKNKKPRTHRNLSSKNKKSRVFYNRTKKNI